MSNEITLGERERIIKALRKGYLEDCELYCILFDENGCGGFSCHDCGEIIKNKLIALIESPARRSMKATEFADKLEELYKKNHSMCGAIAECLGYNACKTTINEDMKRLCDAIRNLDVPDDCIPCPLDSEGTPIKLGDTVYRLNGESPACIVNEIDYYNDKANIMIMNLEADYTKIVQGSDLTHTKPRTLDDIKNEAHELRPYFTYDDYVKAIDHLLEQAHEMGRKEV